MIKFNKDQNVAGVYCIENMVNGMKYIGQSKCIASRWRSHISELRNGKHSSYWLQSDWDKYGEDAFCFYILKQIDDPEERNQSEIDYIALYNSTSRSCGYNIEPGGLAPASLSEETRKLISLHHADVSGKNNPFYGKRHSQEIMNKILSNPNYINRKVRGEDSHNCRITEQIAREIKQFFAIPENNIRGSIVKIAKKYNISKQIVAQIKSGRSWNWLLI
jgi:group I intron endonuclease